MTEGERQERRFGRLTEQAEQGLLTYGSYLKIPELLSLQQLRSDPPVHDELLFIVVHQAYELWFKQLLFELEAARDAMVADRPGARVTCSLGCTAIERVLIEHIQVLQTMTPQDFLEFRAVLTPASGFQSAQFRELEFLSGLKDERFLDDLAADSTERERLARRLDEPTLWDGFVALMQHPRLPDARRRRRGPRRLARRDGERAGRGVRRERGPARPRRGARAVAVPARADGGTRDRREARHRRLERRRLPAFDPREALLPGALGTAEPPVSAVRR